MLFHWRNWLQAGVKTKQGTSTRRGNVRLGIEQLETRCTPAILHVGAGEQFTSVAVAAAAANDGDDIQIDAGIYSGAAGVATIAANNLTIEGVNGTAHLDAAGYTIPNLKAIFDITGNNITVRNVEFSGASVPDLNGAGIRAEGVNLTVTDCYFHDNQNGLDGNGPSSTQASIVDIERCQFAFNGIGSANGTGGHNIYMGTVAQFTLLDCYSTNANGSQLVKTRALTNYILYNRLTDETGNSNYEIDVSQGGLTYIIGNEIEKAQTNNNHTFVVYDAEGASGSAPQNPIQELYVINNTFVNDGSNFGTGVLVAGTPSDSRVENNIFCGNGTLLSGPANVNSNNLVTGSDPGFVNLANFDYRLTAATAAIDNGTAPGTVNGFSLTPIAQYVHPLSEQLRPVVGPLDIGAYEYQSATLTPPTITTNPTSQTIFAGATVTFTAAASGDPTPTVQWQVSSNGGSTFTNIAGATSTSYSFTATLGANQNQYRAVFSNSQGTATTSAATLTVGFADNFNRANSTTLGSNWLVPPSFPPTTMRFTYRRHPAPAVGGFQVSGQKAASSSSVPVTADQVVGVSLLKPTLQADVTATNAPAVGLFARAQSNGDAYVADLTGSGTVEIRLFHAANYSYTVLASAPTPGGIKSGTLKFTVTGTGTATTLTLFLNGTALITFTNSALTTLNSAGAAGIIAWGANGTVDNFSVTGS
jgi:hypothetical protein